MSVRKPAQVRAPPMAMAMAPMATATAPVSDMSRLSLVLGAGAKEAAAREAEVTGVKSGKGVMPRVRKVIPGMPKGGFKKPSMKNLGRGFPRLFGDDEEEDDELKELAAQRAAMALGPMEMVKARLYTVAAKLNITGLRQLTAIMKMSPMWVNALMMTEGRIEKRTGEYEQMMADNGFDLEAKLHSDEADDKYFQLVYIKMRVALQQEINRTNTVLVSDPEAYEKIQAASNRAAAKILSLAGTSLQQSGPDGRLDQGSLNEEAAKLELELKEILQREFNEEDSDDDKDKELKDLAAQKAPEALGSQEMVKARLFTVAAKFYIHALEEFMETTKRYEGTNLMMFTKGRIEKKTDEYVQMMASNGFDLEAKLKSTDESEAHFQKVFTTMLDALKLSIRLSDTRLLGDQQAFSKLEKAAQLTAAFTIKFVGTELEQPGPKDAAEAESVERTADRLVVMNLDVFKQ